jgi:hypothetical protein
MILKKDSGDEQKFCTTLMEKTVGGIGILNSDLFSDQFFLQSKLCFYRTQYGLKEEKTSGINVS